MKYIAVFSDNNNCVFLLVACFAVLFLSRLWFEVHATEKPCLYEVTKLIGCIYFIRINFTVS